MENQQFCQSCGMPLQKPEDFGTEIDGAKSADYCHYCYGDGKFFKDETMEQMVESCIPFVLDQFAGNADKAREEMMKFFPSLKRWAKA